MPKMTSDRRGSNLAPPTARTRAARAARPHLNPTSGDWPTLVQRKPIKPGGEADDALQSVKALGGRSVAAEPTIDWTFG